MQGKYRNLSVCVNKKYMIKNIKKYFEKKIIYLKSKFKFNDFKKAFTLIELLVATSLFAIVALAGISILLASQTVYKRVSLTRNTTDNLNVVMDSITRQIKFGTNYACVNSVGSFNNSPLYNSFSLPTSGDNSDGSCNAIAFIPQDNALSSSTVFYIDKNNYSLNQVDYDFSGTKIEDYPLTSPDLQVDKFVIKVLGSKKISESDFLQPKASIFISGVIDSQKNFQSNIVSTSSFSLESVISERLIDK
jgi:prepilin-type N-terminal cleavage/methylation domain-containing protein